MAHEHAGQLSPDSILRRSLRTAWHNFDERFVVLDVPSRTLMGLNRTASYVWEHIDGELSLQAIATAIAETYKQPPSRVCAEVIAFAEEMLARGCVEQV